MKALIIEDEVLASRHLQQVLAETGDVTVITTLDSITETIEWFRKNIEPDLVFMDIHLADGLAFEIFRYIKINCPIIFTTAYDEYALRAFKVNSVDYLLKPVDVNDVKDALNKLKTLKGSSGMKDSLEELIASMRNTTKYRTHFLIPSKGDKLIPVQASDVAFFYIDTGIVKAFAFDGRIFRFDNTLDELETMLDPDSFFRANRQYIVSRTAIKDIDIWFNNRLSVNCRISIPERIIISKARIAEFKKWFTAY